MGVSYNYHVYESAQGMIHARLQSPANENHDFCGLSIDSKHADFLKGGGKRISKCLPEVPGALETLSAFNSSEHRYFPRRLSETMAWIKQSRPNK